jgi:2-polyprenyl-3-methyl-5-hydroxy-6-metoxy-1,4-benzoquinol methylase
MRAHTAHTHLAAVEANTDAAVSRFTSVLNVGEEAVTWEEARAANLANWEDRVPVHLEVYGLDAYDDPEHRSSVARHDLIAMAPHLPASGLRGLDLCHLQCHLGPDTISFARAGARVTGVDFSPSALEAARALAERTGTQATWVCSDVLDARAAVQGDFDVVYTSIGTIMWLNDLERWARQVFELLRAGGLFWFRDAHPSLLSVDDEGPDLRLRYPYLPTGGPTVWDDATTYAGDGVIAHTRTYEWPHPVSEIIGSLLRAGLRLEAIDEGTVLPWQLSPRMVEVEDGYAWPADERHLVPCTLTLAARRPD